MKKDLLEKRILDVFYFQDMDDDEDTIREYIKSQGFDLEVEERKFKEFLSEKKEELALNKGVEFKKCFKNELNKIKVAIKNNNSGEFNIAETNFEGYNSLDKRINSENIQIVRRNLSTGNRTPY